MKFSFRPHFLLLLFSLIILGSCTLQKRKHLPGYSIDWSTHKTKRPNAKKETTAINDFDKRKNKNVVSEHYERPRSEAVVGNETNVFAQNIYKVLAKSMVPTLSKDTCDNVITQEGDEFRCKVVEVGVNVIKYKKCGFEDGPLISIPRSEVWTIIYSNGEVDVIKNFKSLEKKVAAPVLKPAITKRMDVMGIVGFSLTLASIVPWWLVSAIIGLVAGILGIIFGIISIARITKKRESRKGLGFAIVSLILGILLVAVTFILWAAAGII